MTRFMPLRAGTYTLSSRFGPRGSGMHWGLDFAAQDGTKIYAAQAGSVVHSGTTVYGRMWDALATGLHRGDQVRAGQHIAFVGNNGRLLGPSPALRGASRRCGRRAASRTPNRGWEWPGTRSTRCRCRAATGTRPCGS